MLQMSRATPEGMAISSAHPLPHYSLIPLLGLMQPIRETRPRCCRATANPVLKRSHLQGTKGGSKQEGGQVHPHTSDLWLYANLGAHLHNILFACHPGRNQRVKVTLAASRARGQIFCGQDCSPTSDLPLQTQRCPQSLYCLVLLATADLATPAPFPEVLVDLHPSAQTPSCHLLHLVLSPLVSFLRTWVQSMGLADMNQLEGQVTRR